MLKLYIIILIGSFLMGVYDGGNMTAFCIFALFGLAAWMDKLEDYKRKRVRK